MLTGYKSFSIKTVAKLTVAKLTVAKLNSVCFLYIDGGEVDFAFDVFNI